MKLLLNLSHQLSCLQTTLYFFKKHFFIILSLGLVAAFGRVIQLGGFGEIAAWANIFLEVVVEAARLFLFLFVLGLANVKKGCLRIWKLFTTAGRRQLSFAVLIRNVRTQGISIILNIIGFSVIAIILNYIINLVAYQTCLFLNLKNNGILAESSSEWTILLFFKNLTVIPFTLVFETFLILWIVNKWQTFKSVANR